MKTRKIMVVLLALLMVAAMMSGCAKPADKPADESVTPAKTDAAAAPAADDGAKYRIGFANASISNSWRVYMRDLLLAACEENNVELIETDANDDANKQISDIESLLQKDLDAILITPCMEDSVNPGIEAAFDSGIPVIIFDRHCSTDKYTHFVSYPDKDCAIVSADYMVAALKEKYGEAKGNIIMLDTGAGSGTQNKLEEGWNEVLGQYPDIKIIARQFCDWERGKAKSFMEDCLQRFKEGEIDGFISGDGSQSLGAMDAIVEAGRDKEGIVFTNTDGSNGVCRLVKEGVCAGLAQFPCRCSVDALNIALDVLGGSPPADKDIFLPIVKVDASNVDEYYRPDADDSDWTM